MSQPLEQLLPLGSLIEQIKWSTDGLVTAVIQDNQSKDVLTVAYMNRESLEKTITSGETWLWSRSRQELWHKGATSGNTQTLTELRYDCDADALLVLVSPAGPACHTGAESCFYRAAATSQVPSMEKVKSEESSSSSDRFAVLGELEAIIRERHVTRPEGAYTTYLFEKGIDKILKKVGEETAESIIAAKNGDNDELRLEVSDLLYHLLVLLQERNLPLDDIMSELDRRHERPRRD
ncbi:phosphoribosyl-ATP pyrophosphohydrolase/phosphoribosyl-AMP cyclohydrolase [Paenibacillus shirakamiensis]|uniref:Histidine biosynthesis bifunctional protein HisIE n=1 Tax=Paenibacillus shirakamiensis TaxID=1265935 RepID=A0ABS4JJX7_9BACL|nr:bifunctional phosphoribosyl-AMP cyclohydrolase/phosphoribosyl-ATP diphosphatase HisIE [Paenibacillus shirakamiensis]MBP2001415.1 phosphoribosyl-ATP pyrophosphohydrolase/phosphoribosyl-AMP cyclohydrolase [Paenibacillus shirakamiensis]